MARPQQLSSSKPLSAAEDSKLLVCCVSIRTQRFPREVFIPVESQSSGRPKGSSYRSNATPLSPAKKKVASAAQMQPVDLRKLMTVEQSDLGRTLAPGRPSDPRSLKVRSAKKRAGSSEGEECSLPPIFAGRVGGTAAQKLPPARFAVSRRNSNQIVNLELASKVKINPPRVTVNLEHAISLSKARETISLKAVTTGELAQVKAGRGCGVRLKPIQRNAYSSQGNTIKVLLPKEFVNSRTRSSSKEEEGLKKTARPVLSPLPRLSSKSSQDEPLAKSEGTETNSSGLAESKARDTGLKLINGLVESNGHKLERETRQEENQEELCNVTFGEKQFQKLRTHIVGVI